MENQTHPKLAHLTKSQIETLIARYYNNEKVQTLVCEYQIDCIPSKFHLVLPPETLGDHKCRYCDVPLVRERLSRSSLRYRELEGSCPRCGHYVGTRPCRCEHCLEDKRLLEQIVRETKEEKIRAFCRVARPASFHQPAVEELDLRTAVGLLALARTCLISDERNDECSPSSMTLESLANAAIPWVPRGDLSYQLLDLLSGQGLIAISELSSVDAFGFEEGDLREYYPSKIRWMLTVEDPERLLFEISRLADRAPSWPNHWGGAIKALWLEISFAECKEYFRYSAEERGLPVAGEKSTDAMLKNLLEHFSVGQCYRILWAGAQRASDFLVRTRCTRKHAANYMIGECQRWGDRARAEKWEVKPFRRNFNLPRSAISYVFFDVFLQIGEAGFDSVPGAVTKHVSPPSDQHYAPEIG